MAFIHRDRQSSKDSQSLANTVFCCFLETDIAQCKGPARVIPANITELHRKAVFIDKLVVLQVHCIPIIHSSSAWGEGPTSML